MLALYVWNSLGFWHKIAEGDYDIIAPWERLLMFQFPEELIMVRPFNVPFSLN